MSTRIGVAAMAALLALYIALVAQRAWLLLTSGQPIGVVMGIALLGGIPWLLRERRFDVAHRLPRALSDPSGGQRVSAPVSPGLLTAALVGACLLLFSISLWSAWVLAGRRTTPSSKPSKM